MEKPPASREDKAAWTQRVGGLCHLPDLLAELGVQPAIPITSVGLDPGILADPEQRLPFAAVPPLLQACVRQTGCEHFGLLLGQRWRLADFGLLGALLRHCETIGEALRVVATYQRLNSDGAAVYLYETGSSAMLGYAVHHPDVAHVGPLFDAHTAVAAAYLAELSGGRCRPDEVRIPRAMPADPSIYRAHFGCPVHFGGDQCLLRLSSAALRMPIPGADAMRRRAVEAEAARRMGGNLVPQLHRAMRLLMIEGHVSGAQLAQQLDIHRRTLDRRLQALGTTFGTALQEARLAAARQLLRETELPIAAVAAALGYAEPSPFNRAFKRWTGTTPLAWRRAAQEPALAPRRPAVPAPSAPPS